MVHNLPDVTPGGSAVPLSASRLVCNWLQVICPTGNSAAIRIGDSTTSATSGAAIPAGSGMMFPPIADDLYLDLAMIYVFGTTTDKISIVYGKH